VLFVRDCAQPTCARKLACCARKNQLKRRTVVAAVVVPSSWPHGWWWRSARQELQQWLMNHVSYCETVSLVCRRLHVVLARYQQDSSRFNFVRKCRSLSRSCLAQKVYERLESAQFVWWLLVCSHSRRAKVPHTRHRSSDAAGRSPSLPKQTGLFASRQCHSCMFSEGLNKEEKQDMQFIRIKRKALVEAPS